MGISVVEGDSDSASEFYLPHKNHPILCLELYVLFCWLMNYSKRESDQIGPCPVYCSLFNVLFGVCLPVIGVEWTECPELC